MERVSDREEAIMETVCYEFLVRTIMERLIVWVNQDAVLEGNCFSGSYCREQYVYSGSQDVFMEKNNAQVIQKPITKSSRSTLNAHVAVLERVAMGHHQMGSEETAPYATLPVELSEMFCYS